MEEPEKTKLDIIERMRSIEEPFIEHFEYLKRVLGDRLLAYMLAHDNLEDIKNKTFVPTTNQLATIYTIVKEIENLGLSTNDGKLFRFVGLNYMKPLSSGNYIENISQPNSIANILHQNCTTNSTKIMYAEENNLDEVLICQIAKDLFPKIITPIKGHDPYSVMANPPTDRYHDLLFLLTRNSMKLRNIFPTMKSEEEYQKAREQGMSIKDIFKDVNTSFWPAGCYGGHQAFYNIPYAIISNATFNFTNNVNNDLDTFIQSVLREYRSFISSVSQKKLKIKFFYGLEKLQVDNMKIIGRGSLRPIYDSDRLRFSTCGFEIHDYNSATTIYELEESWVFDLLLSEQGKSNAIVEFWEKNTTAIQTLFENSERQFNKLTMAITLAYSDHLLSNPNYNPIDAWNGRFRTYQKIFSIIRSPINTPTMASSYSAKAMQATIKFKLTDEILTNAHDYLKQLDSLSDEVINSLEIAMKRLPSAIANDDPRDAIIDGTIVWESLLGSKKIENLLDNLATTINIITTTDTEKIKELYRIRCDIVHGNPKSQLTRETAMSICLASQKIIEVGMKIFKYIISNKELNEKNISNSDTRVKHILKEKQ